MMPKYVSVARAFFRLEFFRVLTYATIRFYWLNFHVLGPYPVDMAGLAHKNDQGELMYWFFLNKMDHEDKNLLFILV